MKRACNACAAPTEGRYCPAHEHLDTGEQGSTGRWRRLRQAMIDEARARGALVCSQCGAPLDGGTRTHLDHRIPRRHGGTDERSNLRLTCAGCNLAKGARLS